MTLDFSKDYITDLTELDCISPDELLELKKIAKKYPFYCSRYYLSLIDFSNPDDAIRKIVIPHSRELEDWGRLDPSDEQSYTVIEGLEHKYNSTALLLVAKTCGGICRYCFRKRVFLDDSGHCLQDLDAALNYIAGHSEITNVLLTGGDPLTLSTSRLTAIISAIRKIRHVKIIRIGSRVPVYNPYRIIEDSSLTDLVSKYSYADRKIYIMNHFIHPRELTDAAIEACQRFESAGAILTNQTPLLAGINDSPDVLAELFSKLSFCGIIPYYVFQCRPASGNKGFSVPIEKGYSIFEQARSGVSGLAKRARFVMSHSTGKIEIIGRTEDNIFMKYHRAADDIDSSKVMIFKSNPAACWLDDYDEVLAEHSIEEPYRTYGPE